MKKDANSDIQKTRIGIIGTGMLGSAVGLHLLHSGFELTAYNRTTQKTKKLESAGAHIVESPKNVAVNSDIVITIVKDADAVSEVSFGKNGIINGIHDDLIVADMSTIDPFRSKDISAKFAKSGIKKLDIPVMGGPGLAASGDLIVMVSGDKNTFERFKKIFKVVGSSVFYLGVEGAAHAVKLAMNLQITMLALSLSEGMILVEKSGIKPEAFLEVLNSTYFKTGMSQNKAYKMAQGMYNPTFTLNNLKKDITTITGAANALGIKLPMIEKAGNIYQDAVVGGFGEIDYTGIIAHIKRINGLDK
ncbi:MAG: NAD(P)-dependent oxidoreductase [Thaumarchaeota archaeon]|nr:NAD(P)-dependent oxidoreductase [Nitrososphaerota archaeon]